MSSVSGIGSYSYGVNMISCPLNSGTQTLAWNHENRLWKVSRPSTTTSVYTYDADGERVKKAQGSKATYYYNNIMKSRSMVAYEARQLT